MTGSLLGTITPLMECADEHYFRKSLYLPQVQRRRSCRLISQRKERKALLLFGGFGPLTRGKRASWWTCYRCYDERRRWAQASLTCRLSEDEVMFLVCWAASDADRCVYHIHERVEMRL